MKSNVQKPVIFIIVIASMLLFSACAPLTAISHFSANLVPGVKASSSQPAAVPTATVAPTPVVSANPSGNSEILAAYESTLENIYQQVNPSVVNIEVTSLVSNASLGNQTFPFPFFNSPNSGGSQVQQGLGSGFVWDTEGHIVTNNHVVADATDIQVKFSDGTTYPATLVGNDPNSDLAVIKVDVSADKLHPVSLADSSLVRVGQLAIAIGSPFGEQGTMTVGIISALDRSLPASSDQTSSSSATYTIPDIIQTDAPINPGNSGGVLLDEQGQVIGVTAAIESTTQASAGIGFAIPSTIVRKVIPSLIQTGHFDHPYLGISGGTLVPDLSKAMNLDASTRGALVGDVVPGGPADKAGVKGSSQQTTINGVDVSVGGDVITAIDGSPVVKMDDLIAYLADQTTIGQTVTLTVLRNGKEMTLDVTLEARPAQTASSSASVTSGARLGITGSALTPEMASVMNLPDNTQGVLISQVETGSPADQAGLRGSYKPLYVNGQAVLVGGDIITKVDGKSITSTDDLSSLLAQKDAGQRVTLTIIRDGQTQTAHVTLGQ